MTGLQDALERRRASGGKCLVPYVTGGLGEWERTVEAIAAAGADAIEVGIPFSDPVMDGPTIQAASDRALAAGTTPVTVLEAISRLDVSCPIVVMTYVNLVYRHGYERFAADAAAAGVAGVILPDVPLEESAEWCAAADAHGVETVMLAAPTGDDARLGRITERARGFVYGVGLLGVTGERAALAATATEIAARLKGITDKPVLVGVGVSSPEQAVEVSAVSDGVVVGSAVVRRMLEDGRPEAVAELVGGFREALDRTP